MKPHQLCRYTNKTFITEGMEKPKLPQKVVVCPECKRKVNTGLIKTSENGMGDMPWQWYQIVPQHKKKAWWKLKA